VRARRDSTRYGRRRDAAAGSFPAGHLQMKYHDLRDFIAQLESSAN
jgi:hypothetical protein